MIEVRRIRKGSEYYYARRWDSKRARSMWRNTKCTEKRAALGVAARWEDERQKVLAGTATAADGRGSMPLTKIVDAFVADMKRSPDELTPQYVSETAAKLTAIVEAAGWTKVSQITERDWLAALDAVQTVPRPAKKRGGPRARSQANGTRNRYRAAWRKFAGWLAREGYLPADPLTRLRSWKEEGFARRRRRALSLEEAQAMIVAARTGPDRYGISGPDRAALYLTALATGFRLGELRSLDVGDFRLAAKPPFVKLSAAAAKNSKPANQPIRDDVVPVLVAYLAGKDAASKAWPSIPIRKTAKMVHEDLVAGGQKVQDAEGRSADFHALRHTFSSWLAQAGVPPQHHQMLTRHRDFKTTMRFYTHLDQKALADSMNEKVRSLGCALVARERDASDDQCAPETRTAQAEYPDSEKTRSGVPETGECEGSPVIISDDKGRGGIRTHDSRICNPSEGIAGTDTLSVPGSTVAHDAGNAVAGPVARRLRGGARARADAGAEPDLDASVAKIRELTSLAAAAGGAR